MHKGKSATKHLKYKDEASTVMVHAVNINKTTTLCIYTVEEWKQVTAEDHYIRYIQIILSCPEEITVDTKELSNKGYVKPSHQVCLEL